MDLGAHVGIGGSFKEIVGRINIYHLLKKSVVPGFGSGRGSTAAGGA